MDTLKEEHQTVSELARLGRSVRRGSKPKPRFVRKPRPKPYRGHKRGRR